jgi:isopenicillin N synthase-like dioxygenase
VDEAMPGTLGGMQVDLVSGVPVIDIRGLRGDLAHRRAVADRIGAACREHGFFSIVGHGLDPAALARLHRLSREFFAQDLDAKMEIRMERGGRAWRGYFPVGSELTAGRPDLKEGLYFGAELPADHPLVRAGTPLHGPNLFPTHPAGLRAAVLDHMAALTALGHTLTAALALSLALPESYFADRYTAEPFTLFRIFNYPPDPAAGDQPRWGVGEHTDYGLLTILLQDDTGGLEVRGRRGWIPVPPLAGALVCNIGDMLDRMTAGRYRSTPHRVRNVSTRPRLSFPFFFDPAFDAEVRPIDHLPAPPDDRDQRWDHASVHQLTGTYGDYLLGKVGRVFPELSATLPDRRP